MGEGDGAELHPQLGSPGLILQLSDNILEEENSLPRFPSQPWYLWILGGMLRGIGFSKQPSPGCAEQCSFFKLPPKFTLIHYFTPPKNEILILAKAEF